MKITGAFIYEPLLEGAYERPILVVQTDSVPDVTIEPVKFPGGWTVGKTGPFVQYQSAEFAGGHAGEFNVRFRNRFAPVVDIVLQVAGQDDDTSKSLPLTRARQLVRKYADNWRLLLNDKDGQAGLISWVPVETNPPCKVLVNDGKFCGRRPAAVAHVQEVDVPMCSTHMHEHNQFHARMRTSN